VPALPLTPPAVPIIKPKAPRAPKPAEAKEAHIEPPSSTPSSETPAKTVPTLPAAVVPAVPKSWAELVKTAPGKDTEATRVVVIQPNGTSNGKVGSIPQILSDFQIRPTGSFTIPFLEPRGLVNTGNMCFMNAVCKITLFTHRYQGLTISQVLQMLVFCGPFYYFLDRVGKEAAHNFKNETPLIDAMFVIPVALRMQLLIVYRIMFMREFRVTPITVKQDLEALGEPFVPEFLYEVIHKTKNFTHMRVSHLFRNPGWVTNYPQRGHQQDAEEFLGFLLDGLHEEAVKMMRKSDGNGASSVSGDSSMDDTDESGWMEVGHKQKAATTRTTEISESPITKIFGGKLRSVLQVPGLKDSVTLEPYTPLQLDIQAPEVRSVVDALKHLTTPEKIQGDFKSPKGPNVVAKKQVSIKTLPPVLILHLKRFQYDNTGGTQKIWKKIGYPLELQIPPEAMSPTQRAGPSAKYRLIGVVYHHGKSASGGHYTVDVLHQDAKNWIRLDDTVIRRVRSEEVAVDDKDLGSHNTNDGEENDGWVNGWEEVTANGSGTTNKGEGARYIGKDSKVAYILFYQKL